MVAAVVRGIRELAPKVNRRTVLVAVVFLCLFIGIGYVFDVFDRDAPEAKLAWYSTLLGTICGVGLTGLFGVWLFYYQIEVTEDRNRRQLLHLLAAELNETLQALDPSIPNNTTTITLASGEECEVVTNYIQPLIVEQAARVGLIGSPETPQSFAHNTFAFVRLARRMREYNIQVQALYPVLGGLDEQAPREAINNTKVARKDVVRDCHEVLTWLREKRGILTDPPPPPDSPSEEEGKG